MVTIIYGPEQWLGDHYREKEVGGADFVRATSFSSKEALYLETQLLFDEPRLLLVLDSEKGITDRLVEYVESPNRDSHLVIQLKECDTRSKSFKSLTACDGIELIVCNRYRDSQYRAFLMSKLSKAGKKITEENLGYLAERIGYGKDDDVTLYSVENLLDNLILASDEVITAEAIEDVIPLRSAVDRFGIAPLISKGEKDRVVALIPMIREKIGTVAFLNILLRELRVVYKQRFFTKDEIGASSYNFKDWDKERVRKALVSVNAVIRSVTSSQLPEESALYVALEGIM